MMLKKFIAWIRQVFGKMIEKADIKNKLNIDIAVSDKMQEGVGLWSAIYENRAPWLCDTVQSMNLGAIISSKLARMITLEMESEIAGSSRADYLNEQYRELKEHLRVYVEYGCAKGGIAFKPYIDGKNIAHDAVQADRFFPTAFNSAGKITGAVFVERLTKGNRYYTRLERHNLTDAGYEVTNKAYSSLTESSLGNEVPLESVDEWASVEPEVIITGVDRPLFAYYRVAQANTVDPSSPLGVSVFARATDLIKEADKQYSRLLWENEAGEMAVDIDATLFEPDDNGHPIIPHGKKRLYRTYSGLGLGEEGDAFKVFAPPLRDQSIINSLKVCKQNIEDACGLYRGMLSEPQETAKTATEIVNTKQDLYATVHDNQIALQHALEDYIYAMDVWTTLGSLAPAGKYETTFKWDDSIITDAESEREKKMQEVVAGILKPEAYLMETRGITEEEARKLMPGMEKLAE